MEPRSTIERNNIDPEYKRIFDTAKRSSIVESGLYSPEQAAYFMSWKERIRGDAAATQKDSEFGILYGGIGPDISSALLLSDATHVIGVDIKFGGLSYGPVQVENFQKIIDEWQDENPINKEILFKKRRSGFYHANIIEESDAAYLIILELRSLGVDLHKVQISKVQGACSIQLSFPWAYPGESQKRLREITIANGDIRDPDHIKEILGQSKIDCYYEKSMFDSSLGYGNLTNILDKYTKEQASVIMGMSQNLSITQKHGDTTFQAKARKSNYKKFTKTQSDLASLGQQWKTLSPPISATKQMLRFQKEADKLYGSKINDEGQQVLDQNYKEYGWYLVGAQKKV
ncbi:MAG: hypothetical protein HYV32_05965 [Candidatus Kerfeldbacteria bacterium]|nr:hypothetical protein [Candidatus Kerfeldbacteria bacterium]